MKNTIIFIIYFFVLSGYTKSQSVFDINFFNKSMRIDFVLAGNTNNQSAYLLDIKEEQFWGGAKNNLIDNLEYGEYRFSLYSVKGKEVIYSRGFCTLFEEWRTTDEAKIINKAFTQTVNFPFPKNKVEFILEARKHDGSFELLLEFTIDPKGNNINKEGRPKHEVVPLINNGTSDKMVDLTFIAEGYTLDELDKFKNDVIKITDYIFSQEPFISLKHKFNIWAVCSPSADSGTDNPRQDKWVNTAVNSSFNTFYIDRYLETTDVISVRDIASCAPYDHICVLVNSNRYGGGGIYNHFSIGTSDHHLSAKVMLHELGHGLAGLADEYYTSDVAYNDFFDLNTEPWQPNITTLINFDSKWKHLIDKETPIPTPDTKQYKNQTGVFEGGGYVAKGVYRPYVNCRMKSNEADKFCEACQEAITKMIIFLTN